MKEFKESVKPKLVSVGIPITLFLVALALRILYLYQAEQNDPNFSVLLPSQDMYEYDFTARQYAEGNFDFTARENLSTSSFYPYALALLYKISDNSRLFVRLFQAVLSSVTVVLLYMIALRFTGRLLAVVCGLILAFYGVSIYFSMILLPATLILFLYTVMLLFVVKYRETFNQAMLALAGLMLGFCVVARANNIVILPFLLICVLANGAISLKERYAHSILLLVATAISPGIWVLKTLLLAKGADTDLSIGLYGFLIGNTYDATGIFFDSPASAVKIFSSSGGSYVRGMVELLKTIVDHPAQWVWVEARKLAAFWIGFEPADNMSYHVSREFSSLLRLPLPSFGVVSAMGLLGMVICLKDTKRLSALYLMTAGTFFSVVIFFILSRYRLVAVPTLILFGALSVERICERTAGRQYARAAGLVVAAGILLSLTREANIRFLYPASYLGYFESMARHNAAVAYITNGKPDLGEIQLKRLLDSNPHFSHAYATYAVLCESQGRNKEALKVIEKGLKLMPSDMTLLSVRAALVSNNEKS